MNETQFVDNNVVKSSQWRWVAAAVVAVLALLSILLGVAWFLGWYPFAGPAPKANEALQMIDSTTAKGGPTLSEKQIGQLVKDTTAQGTSTLTKSQEDALIKATSVSQ